MNSRAQTPIFRFIPRISWVRLDFFSYFDKKSRRIIPFQKRANLPNSYQPKIRSSLTPCRRRGSRSDFRGWRAGSSPFKCQHFPSTHFASRQRTVSQLSIKWRSTRAAGPSHCESSPSRFPRPSGRGCKSMYRSFLSVFIGVDVVVVDIPDCLVHVQIRFVLPGRGPVTSPI